MLNCDMLGQCAVSDGEVQRTVRRRVHEFMSLTASGKKLHLSLVVQAPRLRSLLPEASRVNSSWARWVWPAVMFMALVLHLLM